MLSLAVSNVGGHIFLQGIASDWIFWLDVRLDVGRLVGHDADLEIVIRVVIVNCEREQTGKLTGTES